MRLKRWFRLSRGVVMPSFPWVANKLIAEHDVVQMHIPLLESWLVTLLGRRQHKGVVCTHHGDLVMPAGPFDQFVQSTVTFIMRQALQQAAAITIHTQDYADQSPFLNAFRDKLTYVLPPVSIPQPDQQRVQSWRAELGLQDNKLIGFAGRFVEEKGFDYLLKAIPLVLERIPNAKFVYAGEVNVVYESFYDKWRHLVERNQDHLVMLGLLSDPQKVADFYGMCDVLALPSRTDCFPMVQVEAMLSGTPAVATDIPGMRVPIKLTGMGKLVPPRDEHALADGLVEVLSNRSHYLRSREQVEAVFDLSKTVDTYEGLMQRLANRGKTDG